MDIQIIPAWPEDYTIVQNLTQYYIYDFSEFMGWDPSPEGLFGGCDELPQYWGWDVENEQLRWPKDWVGYPFIIRVDGVLAGFAMIRRLGAGEPPTYEVGEFFVLRRFRRHGVGKTVAQRLFDRFRGNWVVKQMYDNTPARDFWHRTIDEYTGGKFEEFLEYDEVYELRMAGQRFSNSLGSMKV